VTLISELEVTQGACPTVDLSIWIDPLVRAMWIDPPLDALERSTKKTKMATFTGQSSAN